MKKLAYILILALFVGLNFTSCREKTQEEKLIQEMKDQGAEIKVKDDGDKIKMETEDTKVKIKKDGEETKIKVKEDSK